VSCRRQVSFLLVPLAVALVACGSGSDTTTLNVSAAASLTNAFGEVEAAFEQAHPDVDVVLNFASSSDLVTQIVEGAPVDVFASADTKNMEKISAAGLVVGNPSVFATNSLRIIVAPGNPLGITGLGDLARPGLVYVTCDPNVPIGRYAQEVLDAAGVVVSPASFEENVKGVVAKVMAGEADAGIVYTTDVLAAGDGADGVDIPEEFNVSASYPIAVLESSTHSEIARSFVEFVNTDAGMAILGRFGFGTP